jgi:hypothetical protein
MAAWPRFLHRHRARFFPPVRLCHRWNIAFGTTEPF